jgi:hypothetical protein
MNPDLPPAVLAIEEDDAAQWTLSMIRPAEGFIGAVATRQPVSQVVCFQLLPAA